jgi:chromosome segregation ATPase
MSESFEESGVAVDAKPEGEPHEGTDTLAVSMNDFSALEDRVLRAVDLVKNARHERAAAEARAAQAEERATQLEERAVQAEAHGTQLEHRAAQAEERAAQAETKLREQAPVVEGIQSEVHALRAERDHVRHRVERLLEQLDGLEL